MAGVISQHLGWGSGHAQHSPEGSDDCLFVVRTNISMILVDLLHLKVL